MEDEESPAKKTPPTKLHNPKLFRPFEMYVKMYGLPAYNELDPTWFVAITYSLIFGAMFGDVGQGLILFLAVCSCIEKATWTLRHYHCAGVIFHLFRIYVRKYFGFEEFSHAIC